MAGQGVIFSIGFFWPRSDEIYLSTWSGLVFVILTEIVPVIFSALVDQQQQMQHV